MHTVPGFLLLLTSVTAHSHSHCILSTVPAQTFMWPCWESNRGIDPAKNNSFFFSKSIFRQSSSWCGRVVENWWAAVSGCEAGRPGCPPGIWLCWLKLIGTEGTSFQEFPIWLFSLLFIALVFQAINGLKKNRTREPDAHNIFPKCTRKNRHGPRSLPLEEDRK